jgi:hypothetical protein
MTRFEDFGVENWHCDECGHRTKWHHRGGLSLQEYIQVQAQRKFRHRAGAPFAQITSKE